MSNYCIDYPSIWKVYTLTILCTYYIIKYILTNDTENDWYPASKILLKELHFNYRKINTIACTLLINKTRLRIIGLIMNIVPDKWMRTMMSHYQTYQRKELNNQDIIINPVNTSTQKEVKIRRSYFFE